MVEINYADPKYQPDIQGKPLRKSAAKGIVKTVGKRQKSVIRIL